jgi:hypothetical protein
MFDEKTIEKVTQAVRECTERDRGLLDTLRSQVNALKSDVRVIKDRQTTSVALVASDGGNNRVLYDPFLIQLIRVVDSYGEELCMEAVSPSSDTEELSQKQFDAKGDAITALGRLMRDVDVTDRRVSQLAYGSIPTPEQMREHPDEVKEGWVQTYRDIWEWAVLYDRVVYGNFGTSTLLVRDGLLRAKFIRPPYFERMVASIEKAIERIRREHNRDVFLVGLAKHSKVIERYRLAMTIENVMSQGAPRYVQVPKDMEMAAYAWAEWTLDPKFSAGQLHLVRFGSSDGDQVWAVDILRGQLDRAPEIFGYLLVDAKDGFPVPMYPACLQRAHEHAEVVDWDLDIFQNALIDSVHRMIPEGRRMAVDAHRLIGDTSGRRY